jgi:hypothetical protein
MFLWDSAVLKNIQFAANNLVSHYATKKLRNHLAINRNDDYVDILQQLIAFGSSLCDQLSMNFGSLSSSVCVILRF